MVLSPPTLTLIKNVSESHVGNAEVRRFRAWVSDSSIGLQQCRNPWVQPQAGALCRLSLRANFRTPPPPLSVGIFLKYRLSYDYLLRALMWASIHSHS